MRYAWLLLFAACYSFPKGWTEKRSLLAERQEMAVVTDGARMFLVGGLTANERIVDWLDAYTPANNTWARLRSMPERRHHPNVCVHSGAIYVLGSLVDAHFNASGECWRYTIATDEWAACAPMPEGTERGAGACVTFGDKLYVFGGIHSGHDTALADVSVYDPATDTWRELPALPEVRNHMSAIVLGGAIHVIGGRVDRVTPVGRVDIFDPATETYSRGPDMGVPRSGYALGFDEARGVAYVFGGEGDPANPLGVYDTVEAYDGAAWRRLPKMPRPRHGFGAATLSGVTYLPGGGDIFGFGASGYHDAYSEP